MRVADDVILQRQGDTSKQIDTTLRVKLETHVPALGPVIVQEVVDDLLAELVLTFNGIGDDTVGMTSDFLREVNGLGSPLLEELVELKKRGSGDNALSRDPF